MVQGTKGSGGGKVAVIRTGAMPRRRPKINRSGKAVGFIVAARRNRRAVSNGLRYVHGLEILRCMLCTEIVSLVEMMLLATSNNVVSDQGARSRGENRVIVKHCDEKIERNKGETKRTCSILSQNEKKPSLISRFFFLFPFLYVSFNRLSKSANDEQKMIRTMTKETKNDLSHSLLFSAVQSAKRNTRKQTL